MKCKGLAAMSRPLTANVEIIASAGGAVTSIPFHVRDVAGFQGENSGWVWLENIFEDLTSEPCFALTNYYHC